MNAIRTGDRMRAYADIYGEEEYLRSYIESESPYYESAQQYLDAGTGSTEVLRMMIDAANADAPFQYFELAEPAAVPEAATAQFPGAVPAEPGEVSDQLTEEEFNRIMDEARAMTEQVATQGSVYEQELAKLGRGEFPKPTAGLLGRAKSLFDAYAQSKYIQEVEAPRDTYRAYQNMMRTVGEKATQPAVMWTKKEFGRALGLRAKTIEAAIESPDIGGGPGRTDTKRFRQLFDQMTQGILPPADEYSEEFRKKIMNPDKYPLYAKYLFLMRDEASRVRTRGEISIDTIIPPRVYVEHPLLSGIAHLGIGMAGEALERAVIEPFEHPEYWHWYLAGETAGVLALGPGKVAVQSWLARRTGAGVVSRVARFAGTKRWYMGRAFKKYLHDLYGKPGARLILSKKKPIPMEALQAYFRDAGATSAFLQENPFVVDVLDDIVTKQPKALQRILDTLNKAITPDGDDLDNMFYDLRLPRGPAVKDYYALEPGKIARRDPSAGVLDMIAMNEGEDGAALAQTFWNKGINTSYTTVSDDAIEMLLQNPSDEALRALSGRGSPFAVTSLLDPEDIVETSIRIPKNKVGEAIKFLNNQEQFATPIQFQKTPKQWFMDLEDAVDAGWLTPDQLEALSKTIILPEEAPIVEAVRPAPVAGGPAAPPGDIGAAPPPAEVRPVVPESQVAPQLAARTKSMKQPWEMPVEEWMITRELPADVLAVQRHPARLNDWVMVRDNQIDNYLTRLHRVVRKYTPEKLSKFESMMQRYYTQPGKLTRGDFEQFLQMAHTKFSEVAWATVMEFLDIDDPRVAARTSHKMHVEARLAAGGDVPDEVLVDYPGLVRKYMKTIPEMTMDELERTMVPPVPPREAQPAPMPMIDASYKNSAALRKLGWTDNQIKQMSTETAARAIGQGLTANQYKLRGNKILSVAQPDVPAISVDDLAPKPLAARLLTEVSDDNMRALYTALDDPRLSADDVLQTLSDNIPEVAATLKTAGKPDDPEALLRSMFEIWNQGHVGQKYLDDVMKAKRDEEFRNLPEAFIAKMIRTYKQLRKAGKAPELTDPALQVSFATAQGRESAWLRKVGQSAKHKIISHWNQSLHPEGNIRLFNLDRKLRKLYPQFWDDYRTGVIPLGEKAVTHADTTMGYIFADLNTYERQHVLNILGLRDYIATLSDDLAVPGAWSMDLLMNNLDIQMKAATPRITGSVDRFNDVMRIIGMDDIARGNMSPAALRSNYFPHYVLEYDAIGLLDDSLKRMGTPSQLRTRPRMYTRKRYGSPKEIALNESAIKYRLAMKYMDDGLEDWGLMQLETYDLWDTIVKAGMTPEEEFLARAKVFGTDKTTGKIIRPKRGQRIAVEGSEDYIGFQFDPGNAYYQTNAMSSDTALGHFIEDLLLIDPTDAERLASQLDLQDAAKGIFPEAIQNMIDSAGPRGGALTRRVRAIGRQNKVYMVGETMNKRLLAFRNQAPSNIPGLLSIMKFTSKWKQLTLDWAGVPFHMGNIMGDSYNMFRTSGFGPCREIKGASRMLANIHRPVGREIGIFGEMTGWDRWALELALDKQVLASGFSGELAVTHPITNPTHWYQMIQRMSGYREALMRLSMFRYQLKHFQRYGKWNAPGFNRFLYDAAGKPKLDMVSGSALVGRRFTVDYEALPAYYNQIMRGSLFPFVTFWDQNARNWGWFMAEAPGEFAARILAPRVAAHAYNNLVWPEIEASLGGLGKRGHLNLWQWDADDDGVDDYGLVLAPQLPLDMAAQMVGLDRLEQKIVRYYNGFYGKDPKAAAKQIASEQLADMGLAVPRLAEKLANPMIQIVEGILINRHPFTGKPILTENQKKLPTWRKMQYYRKFALGQVITPFGQFMMNKNNQNYDTLDALGINPREPMRTFLRGPGNIIRGMGVFVVDLKKDEQDAAQFSKMSSVQIEAGIKEDLFKQYYEWEGTPHDYVSFLAQPEVLAIIADGQVLGLMYNLERIKSWLDNPGVQVLFYQTRFEKAKTSEERLEAKKNLDIAIGIQKLKGIQAVPVPVRRIMGEKLQEMEAFKD